MPLTKYPYLTPTGEPAVVVGEVEVGHFQQFGKRRWYAKYRYHTSNIVFETTGQTQQEVLAWVAEAVAEDGH